MRPTIGISHISQIETAIFDDFASEISHPALVFDIETRPAPAPYAAIEWLVPTTIILFIGKAYFEEFLKEMGKDHYHILKKSIQRLTKRTLNQPRIEPTILSTQGKSDKKNPYSMAFSVVAEGKDNHTLKLLLEKSNGNSNYDKTIEKFIDFIRDYHLTENSAAESEITKSESSNGIILVHLNSETNKIEWLDPLPADVRARLNKKE